MKINNFILLISALFVLSSCNNQEDSSSSSASDATTTETTTSTEESTSSSSTGFENQSYLVETSKIDTDNWKNNFAAGFQFALICLISQLVFVQSDIYCTYCDI